MAPYPRKAKGGCHCRSIRYEVTKQPDYVAYCHCETCRKTTGAPAVAYSVYLEKDVKFTAGQREVYESTPGINRTFCKNCGTPVSYEAEWKGDVVIGFFIGTLDDPDLFPPEKHVFHGERVSWFDASDTLPRYLGVPNPGVEPDSVGPANQSSSDPV